MKTAIRGRWWCECFFGPTNLQTRTPESIKRRQRAIGIALQGDHSVAGKGHSADMFLLYLCSDGQGIF